MLATGAVAALGLAHAASAWADPNQAPQITVPGAQETDINSPLKLENASRIEIFDSDVGSNDLEVSLTATNGTLTLGSTSGLVFSLGDGSEEVTMTFAGTQDEVNAALAGTCYEPSLNYTGAASVAITVSDQGFSGDPPSNPETDSDSVPITVNALGDAPANNVMCVQAMNEDTTLTFNSANGNAISVADGDAEIQAADDLEVNLDGNFVKTIVLGTTTGLTSHTGNGTDNVTFRGTLAEVNAALTNLALTAHDHLNDVNGQGSPTLTITTNDLNDNNDGGPKTDSDSITIRVSPVNDPPVIAIPAAVGTYEDVDKVLSEANGNPVSISEVDEPNNAPTLLVSIAVSGGTVTLGGVLGPPLSFSAGDGTDDAAMTYQAPYGTANAALAPLTFSPDPGFSGTATITIDVNDQGGTGIGGPLTDHEVLSIRVDEPGEAVYWTASKNQGVTPVGAIGRAELDGSGGANLITGKPLTQDNPNGIAIDAVEGRIYWSIQPAASAPNNTPRIYSANLDGTDVQLFLTSATAPANTKLTLTGPLVIDAVGRRIYWADSSPNGSNRGIYWADIDDPTTGGTIISPTQLPTGATLARVMGFALDLENQIVYWTNQDLTGSGNSGENESLSYGPMSGMGTGKTLLPSDGVTVPTVGNDAVESPFGIAVDGDRLFWANNDGPSSPPVATAKDRLRVATLDGTSSPPWSVFDVGNATGAAYKAIALDPAANRIYFNSVSGLGGGVSFAELDGDGGPDSGDLALGGAFNTSVAGMVLLKDPEVLDPAEIAGTLEVGETLTCNGTWAADLLTGNLYRMPASVTYSWTLDGAPIAGANGTTHQATVAGEYRCTQSATNFAGTTASQSAPVAVADTDVDGDGFSPPTDCNDNNAAIKPGATEIAGNAVDENCDGVAAPLPDADGDGFHTGTDCDDSDPAIKPGATEILGNDVDENCDGVADPFRELSVRIPAGWTVNGPFTTARRLAVLNLPAGAKVVVSCALSRRATGRNNCPAAQRTFSFPSGSEEHEFASFKKRRLPAGTVIRIRISAPETIGRRTVFTIRSGKSPRRAVSCFEPSGTAAAC